MLDADHPAMERIQFALQKQIKGAYDLATLKLSEQSEELARQKRKREDVGVQLYQVQQQLAKLQMNLEKVHENHSIIAQLREQAEADLSNIKPTYKQKLAEVKDQRSKYDKYQSDLDQLNMTLRQVEAYNDQMKSEIAVTRRATYKAEESITALEGGKRGQDLLIDGLNEKLKRAQEELAQTEAQLLAQRTETGSAAATLKQAATEMEAINFERKQLLQQWKSALIGMQRRDEALQATEGALLKQREQEMALESEISGVKKLIRKEEERNEVLVSTESKLEAEERGVDANIKACAEKEEKHRERFAMLNKSLEQVRIPPRTARRHRRRRFDCDRDRCTAAPPERHHHGGLLPRSPRPPCPCRRVRAAAHCSDVALPSPARPLRLLLHPPSPVPRRLPRAADGR